METEEEVHAGNFFGEVGSPDLKLEVQECFHPPAHKIKKQQRRSESVDECIVIWSQKSPGMRRMMVGGGLFKGDTVSANRHMLVTNTNKMSPALLGFNVFSF